MDPTHHALLFALLAREAIAAAGRRRGERIIRAATRRYGAQRGRRMAQRARAAGHEPTMTSYLGFGEYRIPEGLAVSRMSQGRAGVELVVTRCPWFETWSGEGLEPYGRLYCLEIDRAVLAGFNPGLELEVRATLATGADRCTFLFPGARLARPREDAALGWDYHAGHLYKTLREGLVEELGQEGARAAGRALEELGLRRGAGAARAVSSRLEVDFDLVPGA
jgi:hypothetical protein